MDLNDLLRMIEKNSHHMAEFMLEDGQRFWEDIKRYRQNSGIDFSDAYIGWDILCIYIYDYCKNMATISGQMYSLLGRQLQMQASFSGFHETTEMTIHPHEIQLLFKKMKLLCSNDSIRRTISQHHLNFRAKVLHGKVKANRPNQTTWVEDLCKKAFTLSVFCSFVFIPLMAFGSHEEHLIGGGCVLASLFFYSLKKYFRRLKLSRMDDAYSSITNNMFLLGELAEPLNSNERLKDRNERLLDIFENLLLRCSIMQQDLAKLISETNPSILEEPDWSLNYFLQSDVD